MSEKTLKFDNIRLIKKSSINLNNQFRLSKCRSNSNISQI